MPLRDRHFQQGLAGEPVEVEAECGEAVFLCQARLLAHDVRVAQIVKAKVRGEARLMMPFELRKRARDVAPFGKASAPPRIVFRNRVKLRQVKGNQACRKRVRQGCVRYGTWPIAAWSLRAAGRREMPWPVLPRAGSGTQSPCRSRNQPRQRSRFASLNGMVRNAARSSPNRQLRRRVWIGRRGEFTDSGSSVPNPPPV